MKAKMNINIENNISMRLYIKRFYKVIYYYIKKGLRNKKFI